jgi:hypothetical protein
MPHPTIVLAFALLFVVAGCGDGDLAQSQVQAPAHPPTGAPHLEVYKTPTCECCVDWIDHLEAHGFATTTYHPDDIGAIKRQYGIGLRHQSCHTAVSAEGYVFEGHIPAKFVAQFLANPPGGAIGLAVPGMPVGSPGMEVEDKFMPYQVLVLSSDGKAAPYATIDAPEQQF